MLSTFKRRLRHVLEVAIAFAPWLMSMYLLYWLEYGEIWAAETLHRDKISVVILASGMALSFLVHSRLAKRR